jgi:hypothetical protein
MITLVMLMVMLDNWLGSSSHVQNYNPIDNAYTIQYYGRYDKA